MAEFEVRALTLAPGGEEPLRPAAWRGALVVVERGEVELATAGGATRRFGRGAALWLSASTLRLLRNPAGEPAVLVVVRRRAGARPPAPAA